MDIIDILMARALSPSVQVETAAAMAQKAAADAIDAANAAAQAVDDAQDAVAAAQGITDIIVIQNEQPELSGVTKLWVDSDSNNVIQIPLVSDISDEINKVAVTTDTQLVSGTVTKGVKLTYNNNTQSTADNIVKYYAGTGNNTDGTMTQKAITDAINSHSGGGGGTINLGPENAGKIVLVSSSGGLEAGTLTEDDIKHGGITPHGDGVVGIFIDYENRIFSRLQDAIGLNAGQDFDKFAMYGGRKRCNVNDAGQITAFYGENSYTEDGSNGQVMVYQPKFYYKREILTTKSATVGQSVRQENLYLSDEEFTGSKIHPLFVNSDGSVAEYALLPAYEGCSYVDNGYDTDDSSGDNILNGKLSSIAGVKPISGANKAFTVDVAEQMAQRRGQNWHITNMRAESALQMLFMVEYCMMNAQIALEMGASQLTNKSSTNCSLITGSTASLGNATGHATSSTQTINGVATVYTTEGKRAISYRGMENPWGNMWRMIGGVNIVGNGTQGGGIPYICTNYSYTPTTTGNNYASVGFSLPSAYGWIANCGYSNADLDWVYMPSQCGEPANSALPVGDRLWTQANLNSTNMVVVGGLWYWETQDGLFNYACDLNPTSVTHSKTARIMYVPNHEGVDANVNRWKGV